MKLPICRKESRGGAWTRCCEIAYYLAGAGAVYLVWREVRETRNLLDTSIAQQKQNEARVQQFCERVLTQLEQLDKKIEAQQSAVASVGAATRVENKLVEAKAAGTTKKRAAGTRKKAGTTGGVGE